jgi:hypothetical protein
MSITSKKVILPFLFYKKLCSSALYIRRTRFITFITSYSLLNELLNKQYIKGKAHDVNTHAQNIKIKGNKVII